MANKGKKGKGVRMQPPAPEPSERRTSVDIHKAAFAQAVQPVPGVKKAPPPVVDEPFKLPGSQSWGVQDCICRQVAHCGKLPTLHESPSAFSDNVKRVFPGEPGWHMLREQVKALRDIAGLPPHVDIRDEVHWPDYRRERMTRPPPRRAYEAYYPVETRRAL